MDREGFETQQEAKRETLGETSPSTRGRMWEGLTKYLAAEARHAHKAAGREGPEREDRDRRSP
jgi:hypothetical protein